MANLSSRRQLFTWFIIVAPCILIFLWTSGFNSMHHDDSVIIERRVHDEEDVRPKSPVPERHQRVPPARKSFQEVRKSPERLTHTTQQQQVRKRTFDPLSTHEGDNDDVAFHQWCLGLLRKAFGCSITDAVYDPILFNLLVQTLERDKHDSSDPYLHWPFIDDEFVYSDINAPVTPPTHFRTIGEALWWTKRWTSVAITKITRDSELEKLYRRMTTRSSSSSTSELKMKLLENTFIRAFTAQVQHFHIVLQVVTDATLTAEQRVMI
ncbi:GPI-anchored surface protein, putative, partial [Bodo saltans]